MYERIFCDNEVKNVIQINGVNICPNCGSSNVVCCGGVHYQKTGDGFGNEEIKIGYRCVSCGAALFGK